MPHLELVGLCIAACQASRGLVEALGQGSALALAGLQLLCLLVQFLTHSLHRVQREVLSTCMGTSCATARLSGCQAL